MVETELEDDELEENEKANCDSEQRTQGATSQPSATGSQTSRKKLAVKASLASIIPWTLHLVFAAIMYHIEEPYEQKLLIEYERKKTDLMISFEKCVDGNTSEESECVMFKEKWFNMTLQLAQEDPGKNENIHVQRSLFLFKVRRNGL